MYSTGMVEVQVAGWKTESISSLLSCLWSTRVPSVSVTLCLPGGIGRRDPAVVLASMKVDTESKCILVRSTELYM